MRTGIYFIALAAVTLAVSSLRPPKFLTRRVSLERQAVAFLIAAAVLLTPLGVVLTILGQTGYGIALVVAASGGIWGLWRYRLASPAR